MTELDFEELDKAVNNLMKDVGSNGRNPALDDPEDKVVALSTDAESTTSSADSKQSEAPTPVAVSTPAPSVPPAPVAAVPGQSQPPHIPERERQPDVKPAVSSNPDGSLARRRGRFMDVVPPSAPKPGTSTPAKHQGVTLQPITQHPPQPDQQATQPEDTSPVAAEPAPDASFDMEKTTPEATAYPDPIDFALEKERTTPDSEQPEPVAKKPEAVPVSVSVPDVEEPSKPSTDVTPAPDPEPVATEKEISPEPVAQQEPATVTPSQETPSQTPAPVEEPLSSPFIPDAKVEKRPLGASESTPAPSPAPETEQVASDKPEVDTPQKPANLPAELSEEIIAVEADTHETSPRTDKPASTEPAAEPDSWKEDSTTTGSIPQQHPDDTSKHAAGKESENGSIYDTSSYHKPLKHPAKKRSGVSVIVWILVLMVIGALGGAAYFYFTTQ